MTIKHFIPALLWAGIIFIIISIPGNNFPKTGMLTIPHIDKIVHLGMFLVFGVLLSYGLYLQKNPWYVHKYYGSITVLLGIIYGGLTELLQHYVLNMRSGTWTDFLANLFGTIFGVFIFVGIKSTRLKKYLNS